MTAPEQISKGDVTMAENSRERRERAGADARSQQEADAQLVREKTARLRALRLARDAEAGGKIVNNTGKKTGKKTVDSAASAGTRARPVYPYRSGSLPSKKMVATIDSSWQANRVTFPAWTLLTTPF
jgi:hypothetical protein